MASVDNEPVDVGGRGDLTEVRILGEGGGKSRPRVKEVGSPNLGSSHDAVAGRLHCREQFRAESIAGGNGHMRQGMAWGKQVLKSVSICELERS